LNLHGAFKARRGGKGSNDDIEKTLDAFIGGKNILGEAIRAKILGYVALELLEDSAVYTLDARGLDIDYGQKFLPPDEKATDEQPSHER
jgi:hypothetical protein